MTWYPRPGVGIPPTTNYLRDWLAQYINGQISLSSTGTPSASTLSTLNSFEDVAFGLSVCRNCLANVPGSRPYEEKCNATLADSETLASVAAKFRTDWMALWTLNGSPSPPFLSL